jgi:hypothetical protein
MIYSLILILPPREIWAKIYSSEEYDCFGWNVVQFSSSLLTFRGNV